jgi:hypothetical protein
MSHPSWRRGPRALRRPQVRLDHLTLVPASVLPQKARYEAIADRLPHGEVLLVLPPPDSRERQTMERLAALFRARGRHVTVLTEERLAAVGRR